MAKPRFTAAQVAAAIREHRGNVTLAAASLGIRRQSLYRYIRNHPTVREALEEARESMIDHVESRLYKEALDGKPWAVRFFLSHQARHRGYGRETVLRHVGPGPDGEILVHVDEVRERVSRRIAALLEQATTGDPPSGGPGGETEQ